jgi:hypothetical protein
MEQFDLQFDRIDWTVQIISMAVGLVIGLGVQAVICYFTKKYMDAIPQTFHEFDSWQVWLLMIPCWNIVWNFFVFPRLARSYQRLFQYYGVHDTGDSGAGLAMTYCVLAALGVICCTGVIAWVFIILYLVKTAELSRQAQFVVQRAWDAHQAAQDAGE